MEIKSLKYYVTVYETGSFSEAAQKLYLSQQAVSLSVKALENTLGTQLFTRIHNGVIPTAEGTYLYQKTKDLLREYDLFESDLRQYFKTGGGVLDIMLAPSMLMSLSPGVFIEFQEKHPDIQVNIEEAVDNVCKSKIKNYQASFGITPKPCNMEGWQFQHLKYEPLVVLANSIHPLAARGTVALSDLASENFVLLTKDYELHTLTLNLCSKNGFSPGIVFETWELFLALSLVSNGKGIFICPEYYLKNTSYPNIIAIPFSDSKLVYDIGILSRTDKIFVNTERAFISYITQRQNGERI